MKKFLGPEVSEYTNAQLRQLHEDACDGGAVARQMIQSRLPLLVIATSRTPAQTLCNTAHGLHD
jgi:hypothetical protein